MELFRVNPYLVYDDTQGALMIYDDTGVKMLPRHYVTRLEYDDSTVTLYCESKYHKEVIVIQSSFPSEDADKIEFILHH